MGVEGLGEDELLVEMERVEVAMAALAARQLELVEALVESRVEVTFERRERESGELSGHETGLLLAEVYSSLEDEVALATGVSAREARSRLRLVREVEVAAPIRAALVVGSLSWSRAVQVHARVQDVPVEAVAGIVGQVTAPYPARGESGVGGLRVPHQVFTARLSRQVARHATLAERNAGAVVGRYASLRVDGHDGTAALTLTGHAARTGGAYARVDHIARRLRREGDSRTLNQLRSDVAVDLILYGHLPLPTGAGTPNPYATFAGELPAARVDVSVSLSTLVGASAEPGTLECGGRQEWLSARVIRDIALAEGSVWRRLVTDPVTGYMVDVSSGAYAVTGVLRERVIARDRVTRGVGRVTPARLCDTDHDVDWAAGGATAESNVSAKDRRAHNHKTRRTWQSRREPGIHGRITWTTPTGRTYVTSPWDYRDPDRPTPHQLREQYDNHCRQEDRDGDGGVGRVGGYRPARNEPVIVPVSDAGIRRVAAAHACTPEDMLAQLVGLIEQEEAFRAHAPHYGGLDEAGSHPHDGAVQPCPATARPTPDAADPEPPPF